MAMTTILEELHELIYGFDKEELRTVGTNGDKALLRGLLKRLPEEGIDPQDYLQRLNNAPENKKKKSRNKQEPKQQAAPSIRNVEPPPPKNVKQEKISMAVESDDGVGPMPPPKMPAPRMRRIKTEAPDEPRRSTRTKNVKQNIKKESVILQEPEIPLVDLTNNIASSLRRTRSKIRKVVATEVHPKNNVDEILKDKTLTEDHEEGTQAKSKLTNNKNTNNDEQQINANSPPNDEADNKGKSTKGTHCGKVKGKIEAQPIPAPLNNGNYNEHKSPEGKMIETIVPPEKKLQSNSSGDEATKNNKPLDANAIPYEKLVVQLDRNEAKSNLNDTYTLPLESQKTNTSVAITQPPTKINTPAKSNKTFTPLKNTKTLIPKFKSPCSSSTPLNAYKPSQTVFKGQDSLQKKEEMLRALEKSNKKKNIESQRELDMKKEAQTKREAAKKLMEKKQAELLKKTQEQKMKANHTGISSLKIKKQDLIYMTKNTPLLPTVDCYDSDEEHKRVPRSKYPTWASSNLLERKELVGNTAGKEVINTIFIMREATPDLRKVFEVIDDKKLVRSSSAHWKRPPRYTILENHSHIYFSEDED